MLLKDLSKKYPGCKFRRPCWVPGEYIQFDGVDWVYCRADGSEIPYMDLSTCKKQADWEVLCKPRFAAVFFNKNIGEVTLGSVLYGTREEAESVDLGNENWVLLTTMEVKLAGLE